MPCNSDYLAADQLEIEVSRMLMLVDELNTGKHPDTKSNEWQGYHPQAYCKGPLRAKADALAETLCTELRKRTPGHIAAMSLEMQMWWRDHKKADKEAGR